MLATRLSISLIPALALLAEQPRRPLALDDLARMHDVRDPQCSPDGTAVAFEVSNIDVKEDKSVTHICTVGFDGGNERQMTSSLDSESAAGQD